MKKSYNLIILSVLLVAVLFCFAACTPKTQEKKYDNGVYIGEGTFDASIRKYNVGVQVHISDNKVSKIVILKGPTVSSDTVSGKLTNNSAWKEGKDALVAKLVSMSIADIKAVDATAQTFSESELCIEDARGESAALVLAVQDAL